LKVKPKLAAAKSLLTLHQEQQQCDILPVSYSTHIWITEGLPLQLNTWLVIAVVDQSGEASLKESQHGKG